jgi:hypothetical protein
LIYHLKNLVYLKIGDNRISHLKIYNFKIKLLCVDMRLNLEELIVLSDKFMFKLVTFFGERRDKIDDFVKNYNKSKKQLYFFKK